MKKQKNHEVAEETYVSKSPFVRFFQIYVRIFWKLSIVGLISGVGVVLGILAALGAAYLSPAKNVSTLFGILGVALYFIFLVSPFLSGVSYVIRNFSRREHAWISDIFTIARKNYWRAVAVGAIDAVLAFMLYFSFAFYSMQTGVMGVFRYVIFMMSILFLWMHYYLYTMLVTFDFGLKALYLNSLMFALNRVIPNILITLVVLALAVLEYSAAMLFFVNADTILVLLIVSVLGLGALFYTVGFWTYPTIKTKIIDRIMRRRTMLKKGATAPCDFYALRDLSYAGYEYAELSMPDLAALSTAEFVDFSERFKAFELSVLAGTDFCTVSDLENVSVFLEKRAEWFERAANLGISLLVMNAPETLTEDLKKALVTVAEEAVRNRMTFCLLSGTDSKIYDEIRELEQAGVKWALSFDKDFDGANTSWEDGIDQLRYVRLEQPGDEVAQRGLLERLRDLNFEGGVTLFGGERTAEDLRRFNR